MAVKRLAALVLLLGTLVPAPAQAGTPKCFGRPATVVGTAGNDELFAGPGDVVHAGQGDDHIDNAARDWGFIACGGPGADSIVGGFGGDTIAGGRGNDDLYGNLGNDERNVLYGGPGKDRLDLGGEHKDNVAFYEDAPSRIRVVVSGGTATVYGRDGTDHVVNLGGIVGTPFRDRFRIGSAVDLVAGLAGADVFRVNAYAGVLIAGGGDDLIILGPSASFDDAFRGDQGDDTVRGSSAADYISLAGDRGADRIVGFGGDDRLSVSDGVGGNDSIRGGNGTDSCDADQRDRVRGCE